VVGETLTSNYDVFISEKTYKNFLIGQPFISIGPIHHNQQLKNMGFKIYDEIFDYSYDSEIDVEYRTVRMVENLTNYKHSNLSELYNRIYETTIFNKNKAIDYCENDPFIPTELITLYKNHTKIFIDNKLIKTECDIEKILKNKL